ncbi:hypothetical protein EYC80_008824 [Monilinia laxa]|uniref:Uncharacterized protein n=1 Tax=Monilinia laxa TaxID=61186 RepID=A0A5N6K1M4_MONLA|nr:hypothetical protein EYC80_008824 [Monilinia laxa]
MQNHKMPWPNSLSQRPPGTSADDGRDKISTPLPKAPSNTDGKPKDHGAPPPTPITPSDPDRRFSFASSTTPSSPTNTNPLSSSKPLVEEDLLALISEPLSHGGAWSSPTQNQNPSARPKAHEDVYTGIGEYYQKSAREIARERKLIWKQMTTYLNDLNWDLREAVFEEIVKKEMEKLMARSREKSTRYARY